MTGNIKTMSTCSNSISSRRSFVKSSLASLALSGLTSPQETAAKPAGNSGDGPAAIAQGGLSGRIKLTSDRFSRGKTPSFSRDFVLADVSLKFPRRFSEFSGDLSGRLIEALAIRPAGPPLETAALVKELISWQKADGRFGDAALKFDSASIGREHMALLWGNGRLLIGLLEYYRSGRDLPVLESARRLGNFLLGVERDCSREDVRKRLAGQGANGFICFTQLVEGWVRLTEATGDRKYLSAAKNVVPLLEERGIQHAHGFLATLRGFVDLAAATGDSTVLKGAETAYADLVGSPDYTVFGSVLEYFGWHNRPGEGKPLHKASEGDPRDEGCGHADFVRLSLALWRRTGKVEYLERAERAWLNGLLPNQYSSGDFGSRITFRDGIRPGDNVNRSWWCCTMHGYRAFDDLLSCAVTENGQGIAINLFEDLDWSRDGTGFSMRASDVAPGGEIGFKVDFSGDSTRKMPLLIRKPSWAAQIALNWNGSPVEASRQAGHLKLERGWNKGDRLEVRFRCGARFFLRDGRALSIDQLPAGTTQAALYFGPWLMGVDEQQDPFFFGEPWNSNVIELPPRWAPTPGPREGGGLSLPLIPVKYTHGGFTGFEEVTLRPVLDYGLKPQRILCVWFQFKR
jgi:hypothetical protein